jgi:hypothetical protein
MSKPTSVQVTLWCVTLFWIFAGSTLPANTEQSARVHGFKHAGIKSQREPSGRPIVRFQSGAPTGSLKSGGHNLTVLGGLYKPSRNVAVWGQPIRSTRSTASLGGTGRNSERY